MIPKDFIQVPIERVEDLKPGDLLVLGNGSAITIRESLTGEMVGMGDKGYVHRDTAAILLAFSDVYRKAEPVQELIEFTPRFFYRERPSHYPNGGSVYIEVPDAVGIAIERALLAGGVVPTYREVTQDSVSRVLTFAEIELEYSLWACGRDDLIPGDAACVTTMGKFLFAAFQAGVKFATGCSLSESSEVDLSAKDGSRDLHVGELETEVRRAIRRDWIDETRPLPEDPYWLGFRDGKFAVVYGLSEVLDKGTTRTDLGSQATAETNSEAPLGLIEELDGLIEYFQRQVGTCQTTGAYARGWDNANLQAVSRLTEFISRFKSKPSAEPVKGSAMDDALSDSRGDDAAFDGWIQRVGLKETPGMRMSFYAGSWRGRRRENAVRLDKRSDDSMLPLDVASQEPTADINSDDLGSVTTGGQS